MNNEQSSRSTRRLILFCSIVVAAILGAFASRLAFPLRQPTSQRPGRPIVQLVRVEPGFPNLADMIDGACPSVALIQHRGVEAATTTASKTNFASAFAISADGWLLTTTSQLPPGPLEVVFGDGKRVALGEVRADAVSGLAIVKASGAMAPSLTFDDQPFPRVGQFGTALATPVGTGCSASTSMIASDFLADGWSSSGYVRLSPDPDTDAGGLPFLGADGHVLGVTSIEPAGTLIPASLAVSIIDELIRSQPAATVPLGFRVADFGKSVSSRLGDVRSGAGVAWIQPNSEADRKGLRAGDIVTAINGAPVSRASELDRALDALPPMAVLTLVRRTQKLTITLMPAAPR